VGLKKKIQELVFPEGVLIDTKKRQYLTKKVNSVFVVNSLLWIKNKSWGEKLKLITL
jgi:hypothetical protein